MKYSRGHPLGKLTIRAPQKAPKTLNSLIDTGASRTLLPNDACAEYGRLIGGTLISTVCRENDCAASLSMIPEIEFENTTLRNLKVYSYDLPERYPFRAIIGRGILSRLEICFNGARERWKITSSHDC